MRIIGIHDGHNAAACLLEDGAVTHALQEERLTRIKNHDVFPAQAVAWLLEQAGCGMDDVDAVAFNGNHMPVHRDRTRLIEDTRWGGAGVLTRPGRAARRWARAVGGLKSHWEDKRRQARVAEACSAGVPREQMRFVDHHDCHAAAAYYGGAVARGAGAGADV